MSTYHLVGHYSFESMLYLDLDFPMLNIQFVLKNLFWLANDFLNWCDVSAVALKRYKWKVDKNYYTFDKTWPMYSKINWNQKYIILTFLILWARNKKIRDLRRNSNFPSSRGWKISVSKISDMCAHNANGNDYIHKYNTNAFTIKYQCCIDIFYG